MPITRTISYNLNHEPSVGILWSYVVEELDEILMNLDTNQITHVIIHSDYTNILLPKLSSLDVFNTGYLLRLEIKEMDVVNMPRIPSSVTYLVFTNTNLSSLTQVLCEWSNIRTLELTRNELLNGDSLIIPNGPERIVVEGQRFNLIRLPKSIRIFLTMYTQYTHLTGTLPSITFGRYDIGMNLNKNTIYHFGHIPSQIYNNTNNENQGNWIIGHLLINTLFHIKQMNDIYNYKIYSEFGSIPGRIKNAYVHPNNPIVAVMHLASNYPRRMAEFVVEHTIIPPNLL